MVITMKLAYFDPNDGMVLAWLDTVAYSYAELPPAELLLDVTDDQYAAGQSGVWYVVDGDLTKTPPTSVT